MSRGPKARKQDGGKCRMELLPAGPIFQVAGVFTFGAGKYADYNYLAGQGLRYSRLYGACLRHLWAWWRGTELDPESGKPHLAHAVCCLLMILHLQERSNGIDDRLRL